MNPNHPQKGSTIRVDPIKRLADIAKIKALLANRPRDLCLFVLGINTNLRASDLSALTVGQCLAAMVANGDLVLTERKTGKSRRITLNASCTGVIADYLASLPVRPAADSILLASAKTGSALTTSTINHLVKSWCASIGLRGNYGSHTLRKTWGYHQRVTYRVGLPELMVCFNHSSQAQTLDYLCVQPSEIRKIYQNAL